MNASPLSPLNFGRRVLAGAVLGLSTASAFAQPAGFEELAAPDAAPAYGDYAATADFGPAPGDAGRPADFGRGHRRQARPAAPDVTRGYETRKPVYDPNELWQSPPAPEYRPEPPKPAQPSAGEKIDQKLSSRYSNPVVQRFIAGTAPDRFAQLYMEASRLIDSRHIEPAPYQTRVDQALENLRHAVRNPEFKQANGLNIGASQEQAFLSELDRYAAARPVRTANDAVRAMSEVATIAGRTVGLKPSAVAAEFVYGAAESLDVYSAFNPEAPAARPSASTGLEDHVVGIGVEIKPAADGILVVKPVRGGPAEAAGVQPGDVITSINGRQLAGQSMDFAVDQIAGPEGSPVLLGLIRDGRATQLSMRRASVRVYSVSVVQMIDPAAKVGYVKLDKFAEASAQEMDEALWQLYREGMTSLVLDLRGNPGGLLTTAVALSDKFLPGGTIVSTRGRNPEDNMQEVARREKTWKLPLVVLVDENSASASEIFAAAIQENGRGVIVGRKSYGKGTVQTHFPLSTVGGNLKLTTARFYSPNGRVMAGAGVTPDVAVPKPATDDVLPLTQDRDVLAGLEAAGGNQVRELAENVGRSTLVGRR